MILIQQSRFADHRVTEIDRIQTAFKHLSWVICLCSALCALKPKKPKNLKKNSKKPRFFSSPGSGILLQPHLFSADTLPLETVKI